MLLALHLGTLLPRHSPPPVSSAIHGVPIHRCSCLAMHKTTRRRIRRKKLGSTVYDPTRDPRNWRSVPWGSPRYEPRYVRALPLPE